MDEKQEAAVMSESGISAAEIAKELGVSVATVYNWLESSDAVKQQRQERDSLLVAAYKEGWAIWKVCNTFNVSQGTLYNVLHKYDIQMRRGHDSGHDDVIVSMYKDGETLCDIMHATGHSLGYIYKVLDRNKVPRRRGSPTHESSIVLITPTQADTPNQA